MKNLLVKLHSIQKEIGAIKKDSKNPFFKSNYFDINTLIDSIKPLLEKYKIVILQPLTSLEGKPALKTTIVDIESGEMIEEVTPITSSENPQQNGSAITYYRRYALQSFLLLEAEDDDGNTAVKRTRPSLNFYSRAEPATFQDYEIKDEYYPTTEDEYYPVAGEEFSVGVGTVGTQGQYPTFPECPHPNKNGSKYRKCYSCNLKK